MSGFEAYYRYHEKEAVSIAAREGEPLLPTLKAFLKILEDLFSDKPKSRSREKKLNQLASKFYGSIRGNSDGFGGHLRTIIFSVLSEPSHFSQKKCQFIRELEEAYHTDELELWKRIKETLGTTALTSEFFDKVNGSVRDRLASRLPLKFHLWLESRPSRVKNGIAFAALLARTLSYYLDLIKDLLFVWILFNIRSVENDSGFESFKGKLIIVSLVCIIVSNLSYGLIFVTSKTMKIPTLHKALLGTLCPLLPGLAFFMNCRLKAVQENLAKLIMERKVDTFDESTRQLNQLDLRRRKWEKLLAEFKRAENCLENFPQVMILFITTAVVQTSTATVHNSIGPDSLKDDLPTLILSLIWSFKTLITGHLSFVTLEKDGFQPLVGKMILAVQSCVSTASRAWAVVLFFAPSLGLFSSLQHWAYGGGGKVGFHPNVLQSRIDVVVVNTTSWPWDSTVTLVSDIWEPMTSHQDLTYFSLNVCLICFLGLCCCHSILHFLMVPREEKKGTAKKMFHVMYQSIGITVFRDWDVQYQGENNFASVKKRLQWELCFKVAVFTAFNLICLVPMIVLHANIEARNAYLNDVFYPPLIEELEAGDKVFNLLISGVLAFGTAVPILQLLLFRLYYTHGHPWRRIWILESERLKKNRSALEDGEERFMCMSHLNGVYCEESEV